MKKITLIFILTILVTSLNGQTGIKLGLNLSRAKYEYIQSGIVTSNLAGLQAGFIYETDISKEIYFNTGIIYNQKGTKMTYMGIESHFPIDYIDIPLNLCYKYQLTSSKLFIQAGPYMGFGVSSKMKIDETDITIGFGSKTDQLKRMDLGFNFGTGIEIKKVQAGVSYGLGMVDLSNDPNELLKKQSLIFFYGIIFWEWFLITLPCIFIKIGAIESKSQSGIREMGIAHIN